MFYEGVDVHFNLLKQLIADVYSEKIKNKIHRNKDFISYSANKLGNTIFGFLVIINLLEEVIRLQVNYNSNTYDLIY